jgi:hypothetical protein
MLKNEKQLLGFYVSATRWRNTPTSHRIYSTSSLLKLPALPEDQGVKLAASSRRSRRSSARRTASPSRSSSWRISKARPNAPLRRAYEDVQGQARRGLSPVSSRLSRASATRRPPPASASKA